MPEPSAPSPESDHVPPPAPAPRAPLPVLGALAWLTTGGAAAAMLGGALWPAALEETARLYVLASFAAFLAIVFRFQIGLGLLVAAFFGAATRRRRLAAIAGALALVAVAPDLWLYRPRSAPQVAPGADTLTVLSINLLYSRADPDAVAREVAATDPDVIVFQEFSDRDAARLAGVLDAAYPHRVSVPRDDAFGQAVYSRRPFLAPPRLYPPGDGWTEPQIAVDVEVGGRPVRLMNIHLLSPVGPRYITEQRLQAARLSELVRSEIDAGVDLVLAGDFNATPGSHHYRAMEQAGLRESHAAAGRGRGTTWCRAGRLAHLPGIRLDHVFFSPGLVCLEARTGGDTGSDHRPVMARIARRPAADPS